MCSQARRHPPGTASRRRRPRGRPAPHPDRFRPRNAAPRGDLQPGCDPAYPVAPVGLPSAAAGMESLGRPGAAEPHRPCRLVPRHVGRPGARRCRGRHRGGGESGRPCGGGPDPRSCGWRPPSSPGGSACRCPAARFRSTAEQTRFLGGISRKTWAFFETFVGPADHWLPPDNYQEIARTPWWRTAPRPPTWGSRCWRTCPLTTSAISRPGSSSSARLAPWRR